MSRADILGRLKPLQVDAGPLPDTVPGFPSYADLPSQFQAEAERVGTVVLTGLPVAAAICEVLVQTGARRIHWQGLAGLSRFQIEFRVAAREGFQSPSLLYSEHPEPVLNLPVQILGEAYSKAALDQVEVSIGFAEAAIAETGTTVETTAGGWGRVLPIVAPNHCVLLSRKDIIPNHKDYFASLRLGDAESARLLMTGPSRTADIEKTLILGVHGPRRLFVILTD